MLLGKLVMSSVFVLGEWEVLVSVVLGRMLGIGCHGGPGVFTYQTYDEMALLSDLGAL